MIVSSTLITIPGFGNILLDAGEGTWGQLARLFGTDKAAPNNVWDVLRNTKCIFASHIHGDHHMGLSTILRKRLTVCFNVCHASIPFKSWPSSILRRRPRFISFPFDPYTFR